MKISPNGLALVKAFESCLRPVKGRPGFFAAYLDPVNVLTIGWGHTNHHEPKFNGSTVWSQEQCDAALAGDMATFEQHVSRLARVPLAQHEFDALVSWSFNTGGPATASLWRLLNDGNKAAIPANLAQWNKAGGRVLNGLTRRRKAEAELFLTPDTSHAPPDAPIIVEPMKEAPSNGMWWIAGFFLIAFIAAIVFFLVPIR